MVTPVNDSTAAPPLGFGLVGTGYWARIAHARALASTPGTALTAVWGRNQEAAAALAAEFGAAPYEDFDAFLADVDAVAFSVPPDVQSELATRAARAGKHLLLEKPVALSAAAADELVRAVGDAGVASVVFFTMRFQPDARKWVTELCAAGGWAGGHASWLASAFAGDSPFNTPWRRQMGGLWDVAPHAVSLMWPILGPVERVTADAGLGDVTHLVLHHRSGVTSTVTVTLGAPPEADSFGLQVWGEHGLAAVPELADDPVDALRIALTELATAVRSGDHSHPCDVRFGRDVTRVLAEAQRQLDALRA
jgi:predicted dehydrogenase